MNVMPLRPLLRRLVFLGALLGAATLEAAPPFPIPVAPRWLERVWSASWVAHPDTEGSAYGVYHFRHDFELTTLPEKLIVHVSADNRYRLWINGHPVGFGPAHGDALHWRFETYDLAPHLRAGSNQIAAVVWNGGEERPVAQMSVRTAFLLQAEGEWEKALSTGPAWKVEHVDAYRPLPPDRAALQTYIVVGDGEKVDGRKLRADWKTAPLTDASWRQARALEPAFPHGAGTGSRWLLTPRTIPFPEESLRRLGSVRRFEGTPPPAAWLAGKAPWTIPAHQTARVLIDAGILLTAYPELETEGGMGATIQLRYAEALIDAQRQKGNRNDIEGKTLLGVADEYTSGGRRETYSPLWYRCFRYLELEVKTGDAPLVIHDLRARFTAYPFQENARFASDDPVLSQIWNVGWHTARLCAFETYMDCPYYEQLQYVGDTRLQALVSLYVSGDDRLMRNAIELYDQSRLSEGLTQSRYPSAVPQIINTFSLFWVDMVHDHWRHRGDAALVARMLPGITATLDWFGQRIDPRTGLLGPLPYWSFVDWADEWSWDPTANIGGVPDGASRGGSVIISLQYAITLRDAAELFESQGRAAQAAECRTRAAGLVEAVRRLAWKPERSYFSDTPDGGTFSQHAQAFAILAGAVQGNEAQSLIQRTLEDRSLIACTQYFRFYLLRALKKAGLGNRYLEELGPWRRMLDKGLSTFAEKEDPTRSDCHAWSSTPNYEFLATVCGIEPASPGFATVRIEPAPGALRRIQAAMPHPRGEIVFVLDRDTQRAEVTLPAGVTGEWIWEGRRTALKAGLQVIALP